MSDPVPNVELLDRTLQYIEDHPEEWNQGEWVCNTAACFAGNALLLQGLRRIWVDVAALGETCDCGCRDGLPEVDGKVLASGNQLQVPKTGEEVRISDTAQCALGLTDEEAFNLFSAGNSMAGLKSNVAKIKRRAAEQADA